MSAFGLIQAIEAFTRDLNERVKTHPWFSRLDAPIKFNPGKIRGEDWASSTPAWCEVDCRIAVYPGTPLKTFRAELADVVSRAAQRDPFLVNSPPDIVWNGFQADEYILEPGSEFENTVRAAHRALAGADAEERILPAVTDCRFYGRYYGIPSLAYGPSSSEGHGFDESVDLESIKRTTVVIAEVIARWCGVRAISASGPHPPRA